MTRFLVGCFCFGQLSSVRKFSFFMTRTISITLRLKGSISDAAVNTFRFGNRTKVSAYVPGETTSGLFYPLRILWFILFLDVAQRFSVVIISHLVIAACGMIYASFTLAVAPRSWLASRYIVCFELSCFFPAQQLSLSLQAPHG